MAAKHNRGLRVEVSEQVRDAIRGCGLTQSELAALLEDVDKTTISRFLSGERGLSMAALDEIGQAIGLKVTCSKQFPQRGTKGK